MRMHVSITEERIADAVQRQHSTLDNPGFCISCGTEHDDIEPDAQGDTCAECGAHSVYGAEELLMIVA